MVGGFHRVSEDQNRPHLQERFFFCSAEDVSSVLTNSESRNAEGKNDKGVLVISRPFRCQHAVRVCKLSFSEGAVHRPALKNFSCSIYFEI